MAHEDLYATIEKTRANLLEDLARLRKERDEYQAATNAEIEALKASKQQKREALNAEIRAKEDALDTLPVPKTRRTKKQADPSEYMGERLDAKLDALARGELPTTITAEDRTERV